MSRIAPLMGMGAIRFQPKKNIQVEAFCRAAAKQNRLSTRDKDDSRIPEGGTPGWYTFNFRSQLRFKNNFFIALTLENLMDKAYKEHGSGVYSPGLNLVIALKYER